MKIKVNNFLSTTFFIFTLIFSYYLGVAYYDITTGLDFNKYINNVYFFNKESSVVFDSQGTIYFWTIAKFIGLSKEMYQNENLSNLINNKIQFINFIYYVIGLLGLYKLLKIKKFTFNKIIYSLSVLNFFPPGFYLRLTMKPEIMAFAFLPWVIIFITYYVKKPTALKSFVLSIFLSVMFTIKASITGMVLLVLFFLHRKIFFKLKNKLLLTSETILFSLFILYFNFVYTDVWLFSKPTPVNNLLIDKWNHTADLNFFVHLDIKNLVENPFKYLHSDSFLAITLLDTLSDYFTFFWKHEELGNYFPYDTIKFTDNFLIQNFLPQYISIFFTLGFYFLLIYLYTKGVDNKEYFLLPLFGLLVLVINSLGFPSKNFDPQTGDLFKVHYYSFLICISFVFLLAFIFSKINYSTNFILFVIPVFLLVIGFPKEMNTKNFYEILNKLEYSIICNTLDDYYELNCK